MPVPLVARLLRRRIRQMPLVTWREDCRDSHALRYSRRFRARPHRDESATWAVAYQIMVWVAALELGTFPAVTRFVARSLALGQPDRARLDSSPRERRSTRNSCSPSLCDSLGTLGLVADGGRNGRQAADCDGSAQPVGSGCDRFGGQSCGQGASSELSEAPYWVPSWWSPVSWLSHWRSPASPQVPTSASSVSSSLAPSSSGTSPRSCFTAYSPHPPLTEQIDRCTES